MTDKERYDLLLGELSEVIKEKNDTISLQKWQIEDLKQKLETAERYLNPKPEKVKIEIR